MSFGFNKETRRSLRERIRDGVNLIPGASHVLGPEEPAADKKNSGGGQQQAQQKSHSVDWTTNTSSILTGLVPREEDETRIARAQQAAVSAPPPHSPSYLTADNSGASGENCGGGLGSNNSRSGSVSSCSSSTSSSPSKFRTYVVKENDTVTSIAASFDCTPSELMRVNRLITARVLFPGQVLKIPNKRTPSASEQAAGPATPVATATKPSTNKSDASRIIESITYAQRKFLKIKVRHVTDGNGVVSGTLLITPNAVMFDPNVSDPLVIEQGAETYGIIVPIEYIVGASIWSDICGMRVRGKEAFVPPGPRPLIWRGEKEEAKKEEEKEEEEEPDKQEVEERSHSNNNNGECENSSSEEKPAIVEGEAEAEDPQAENSPTVSSPKKLEQVTEHPLKESPAADAQGCVSESTCEVTTWYFCLTIGRPIGNGGGESGGGGGGRSRRAPFCVTYGQKNTVRPEFWFSVGKELVPELYNYWMFWWPNIYGEVDFKAISDRGFEPIDWDNLNVFPDSSTTKAGAAGSTRPKSGSGGDDPDGGVVSGEEQSMAQELNELTKESWEMLKQPYAKLSSFITTRGSSIMKSSSGQYSASSQSSSSVSDGMMMGGGGGSGQHHHHHHHHGPNHPQNHQHQSTSGLFNSHHFSLTNPMNSFFFESFSNISPNHSVFDDTDDDDDEFGSFEQVVTNEELRNLLAMGGEEMMNNLPELIGGKSEILEEEDMKNLTRHLTARAEGYPWTQIFTSSRDGFSLNSLYRRNSLMPEESPVMLLIQDTNSRVFGALVSCSLHTSDSFYGTGQSFLFVLRPEFSVYKWTGENLFFVKGNHDGIWIGAGDGKFGLYIDGDLNCGRTESCQTYGNAPLTEPQDFIIKTLECWAFGNYVISSGSNDLGGAVGGGASSSIVDK